MIPASVFFFFINFFLLKFLKKHRVLVLFPPLGKNIEDMGERVVL